MSPPRAASGNCTARLGAEFPQPEFFRPLVGDVEIGAMPAVTLAVADGFPIAGLVTSARIRLRIGEALRQQRTIAKGFAPVIGQHTQGRPHRLGRQIGRLALGREYQEAAVLNDEFQPRDPLRRAPTDPPIPILERVTTGPPDQEPNRHAVALDELAKIIAHGPTRAEIMMGGELSIKGRDFGGRGNTDGEGAVSWARGDI